MKYTRVVRGKYYDSVTLMLAAKELQNIDEVNDASLSMATDANLRILEAADYEISAINSNPSDLVIAIDYSGIDPEEAFERAIEILERPRAHSADEETDYTPRSLEGALSVFPDANLALISVAGQYAGDVTKDCLDRGLNVMLYSDNVPLETEIELKRMASEKNLIVMGPDCGTAIIKGIGIGFANAFPAGPVGIVAAAGTGLQEVHVQLAKREIGVLHGLGTGGRDVRESVGGISFLLAMEALIDDEGIECLILVGKPPAKDVLETIITNATVCSKPVVVAFLGAAVGEDDEMNKVYFAGTLEEAAAIAAAVLKNEDVAAARKSLREVNPDLKRSCEAKTNRTGFLRGLYSGGTLAYEAQQILSKKLGAIYSNTPLDSRYKLRDSLRPEGNCIIDYGEDEFTQGRLHPMMDLAFRCERLVEQLEDKDVGVVLIDLVLGYGSHPDPAAEVTDAVAKARAEELPLMIAYVCGTDQDPQKAQEQTRILEQSGFVVCPSNAQAALLAGEFASRSDR